jgi:hypothetical protein
MKNLILTVLVTLASMTSFAGPRIVGNGGIAVEQDGKLYMLDLYERGVHKKPFYSKDISPIKQVSERLERAFDLTNMENIPLELLVYKLSEAYNKNYFLGWQLEEAIATIDWRLVNSTLSPTEDVRTPLNGLALKQVAVRLNNVVYVSENLWNKLDNDNKIALIIHEAMYFLVPPTEVTTSENTYKYQNAVLARSVTGLLFTKRFSIEGITLNNSGLEIQKSSIYPKRNKDELLYSVWIIVGKKSINAMSGVNGEIRDEALNNYEARSARVAETICSKLKETLSPEEAKKPYFELEVLVHPYEAIFLARLNSYPLKNGDTQSYLTAGLYQSSGGKELTYSTKIPTKDIVPVCIEAVKRNVKQVVSLYNYKIN